MKEKKEKRRQKIVENQNVSANSVWSDIFPSRMEVHFDAALQMTDKLGAGRLTGRAGATLAAEMMERAMEPWTAARYPLAPTTACRHSSLPSSRLPHCLPACPFCMIRYARERGLAEERTRNNALTRASKRPLLAKPICRTSIHVYRDSHSVTTAHMVKEREKKMFQTVLILAQNSTKRVDDFRFFSLYNLFLFLCNSNSDKWINK